MFILLALLAASSAHGTPPKVKASTQKPTPQPESRAASKNATTKSTTPDTRSDARTDPRTPAVAQYCQGEYADSLLALSPRLATDEREKSFSYCIRSTAVYECLSYAPDGTIRRARKNASAHGTGFAYQQKAGSTLLLTNHHVAEWPLVTDERHTVSGVPAGCKKVSDGLKIVDNESDSYDRDDIPLAHVVSDPQLDAAVLRAKDQSLNVIPWKLGKSAALKERNVVEVRGFPLGVIQAVNSGKVVSAYDHDTEKEWDHDDFVIDALLSQGGSGSPVLAVSCKTGEFELVGMYHAGYANANALNVVVGIDQLRDLMLTQKRGPRPRSEQLADLDPAARMRLTRDPISVMESFFPFGPLTAVVLQRPDGSLFFSVFPRVFPLHTQPILVLEDRPSIGDFGELGRAWFGAAQGLKEYPRSALDAETQSQIRHVLDGLRSVALSALDYRIAVNEAKGSRELYERMSRLERSLTRAAESKNDVAQLAIDLAERLGPKGDDEVVSISNVVSSTTSAPSGARADAAAAAFEPGAHGRRPYVK